MIRDPIASLALERAALLSADIEEQLTARSRDGMRPLLAVLAKARKEAAEVQRILGRDPNANAYDGLAEVMNDTGNPAEALEAVSKAIRLDPQNHEYLTSKAAHTHSWDDGRRASLQ